jgi:dTDP-4-amino-4,6-dideoxygalactose transaminase
MVENDSSDQCEGRRGQRLDLDELAIFGGSPAFAEQLHVGRPNIGRRDRLLERINNVLDTKWLSNMGPYEREFERQLADKLEVKHCIAMCNATVALEIAIRALGMTSEVIVPSFTFIATAHALQWQQIRPVFCDLDPKTHNIDPRRVEELITPRTTGIIGVHLWGRACDIEALSEIAERHNLSLLFDAAHALGCSYGGKMIGGFGDAEVFSFHATKFFNTFEGGAVTTNDDELAAKIRLMKNFGFAGYDEVIYIGTNGKMSEMSAVMGLTSLESVEEFIRTNRENYLQYQRGLAGVPGIRLLSFDENEKSNHQYVVVEIGDQTGITRDEVVQVLHAENIIARRYFYPGCHRMEPYRSYYPHARLMLPQTEKLAGCVMTLPTGTAVGATEIALICQILQQVISRGPEIHEHLAVNNLEFPRTARPQSSGDH